MMRTSLDQALVTAAMKRLRHCRSCCWYAVAGRLRRPARAPSPIRASCLRTLPAWRRSTEPEFAPDGESLVYTVTAANLAEDKAQSDLWRVGFDGSRSHALTRRRTAASGAAQWSADGQALAFLSDRKQAGEDEEDATTQVWMMPAAGRKRVA